MSRDFQHERETDMTASSWDSSAEAYRTNAEKIGFYQVTNREIVSAGHVHPGMVIVDLCCGSGLTTRAVVSMLGSDCTVYAIDQSSAMLQQAQEATNHGGVHFIQSSADCFSGHVPERIDRVFCNSAFWHFPDPDVVLREVQKTLRPDGRFLFNFPDQDFDFGHGYGSQMSLAVDQCLGQQTKERKIPRYSYEGVHALAERNGFFIEEFRTLEIDLSREDLIGFYSIPHVGAKRFPNHSEAERRVIFTEAFRGLSNDQLPRYRWAQFNLALARSGELSAAQAG
jgi:ubiquinone/menaquinone biosynthesis C-methylase UbiE